MQTVQGLGKTAEEETAEELLSKRAVENIKEGVKVGRC